jgi:hypothetical protein
MALVMGSNVQLTDSIGDTVKCEGTDASFTVNASGSNLSYQWTKGGNDILGATNSTFSIKNLNLSDAGTYSCIVSSQCGKATLKPFMLTVSGCGGLTVSGMLNYDNKNLTPMTNTKVYLETPEGTKVDSAITDNSGAYIINNIKAGTYRLDGSATKKWGGVDPLDALLVNKYYTGLFKFTDYLKKRASDVNGDKTTNPLDAMIINKRYVGLINKYPSPDWIFGNDTINVGSNLSHNFLSLCRGDANASYTPPLKPMVDINLIYEGEIKVEANQSFEVPVRVARDIELGAIGIKLRVLTKKACVTGIRSDIEGLIYNIIDTEQKSAYNVQYVNVAWAAENNPEVLKKGQPIFSMVMNYRPKEVEIMPESVLGDFEGNYLSADTLSIPYITVLSKQFSVISYPNPFISAATIEYDLPAACDVRLKVYNVMGAEVLELVNAHREPGKHKVMFDGTGLPEGAYIFRLEASGAKETWTGTGVMMMTR